MTDINWPQVTIYVDRDAIDVTALYRRRGWQQLPPCPTMSGAEIKAEVQGLSPQRALYQEMPNGQPERPISDLEAVGLVDGMRFFTVPPASYVRGG